MLRSFVLFSLVACNSPAQRVIDAKVADAFVPIPDSAPPPLPSVDAGPPPPMACGDDAGACQLPPSTCLDSNYLVYYTATSCDSGMCSYTPQVLYCEHGCVEQPTVPASGGCSFGGFT
jgi:hypothetical protein